MSVYSHGTDCRKSPEELASHYALQVALQTMKERCQQLQTRLSVVEEENLKLKIEKQRQFHHENNTSAMNICDIDKLQEQIVHLSRQKSQLTHHIYMVATENKHLWTKLSILTEANESLGTRLNKISSALNSHTNRSEQLLQEVHQDLSNQSLEEISLKLINNIQEKTELETQYVEMVDLQSFQNCDFTLTDNDNLGNKDMDIVTDVSGDDDSFNVTNDLQNCKSKLANLLSDIRNQNETYRKGDEECMVCRRYTKKDVKKTYCDAEVMTQPHDAVEKDSIDAEVQNINEKSNLQSFCPVCFEYAPPTKEGLAEHVLLHFPPGEIKDDNRFDTFYSDQPPSVL